MKPVLDWNGRGRDKTKGLRSAPQRTQDNAPLLRAHTALTDARNSIPKSIFPGANGRELSRKPRIALYSHDAMGLGHMRRNLLIAQTLAGPPLDSVVLMLAGAGEAGTFGMPPGVDCVTLPALRKDGNGSYRSRSLDLPFDELINMRAHIIRTALQAFDPDVLIVDKVPRGIGGELNMALEYLHARGHTRCVLGLRDVLDEPEAVHKEWGRDGNEDALRAYYDAVWVYGDPAVYDMVHEYSLSPDIAAKVRYTGYLDQCKRLGAVGDDANRRFRDLHLPYGRLVLCMVGGGQDGDRLAEAFAQVKLPSGAYGVIVTGPYMPADVQRRLHTIASAQPRLRVLDFLPEPAVLLSRADRVIAMGGYNTTCEILSFGKPALIVPRVKPRLEQWIRAERLRDMGLLDVLHPDGVTPQAISDWLARDIRPLDSVRDRLDMKGLSRLPNLLRDALDTRRQPASCRIHVRGYEYAAY
ncbi:MAG TPA: glycosyltransferase [Chloroflexia bacterium]